MPRYRIRMINSRFESVDEADYPSLDAVREMAIVTATKVAAEAVAEGEQSAAVELQIHEDLTLVARHVVTLSIANLIDDVQPPDRC